MSTSLGVDVGGTFTDLVLYRHGEKVLSHKLLTTPSRPADGIFDGIDEICRAARTDPSALDKFVHGTTLVANALIERKGARTGLVATEGFRDILDFRTELRYDLFDPHLEFPDPLVDRPLRFEINERMDHHGKAIGRPSRRDLARLSAQLREARVESVAICLLHSYLNPEHENSVAEALATSLPGITISVSSRVLRQIREYDRTSATVINAYVQPIARRYLSQLVEGLRQRGYPGEVMIMTSTGGAISAATAAEFPIQLIESGPAAGVVFAARLSQEQVGGGNMVSFDMGGTTAKVCVVKNGRPEIRMDHEVARTKRFKAGSGMPIGIPVINLLEIGAGGGSIAELDRAGLIGVGPRSAGADPGPACYGLGGTEPTVTDANLILGFLAEDSFLGGRQTLDRAAAERAIEERIGAPAEMDVVQSALAIYRIVTETMAEALRVGSVEANVDLRAYDLMAFGGAAGIHAIDIARRLGIKRVICPVRAGVFSAGGLLSAPLAIDLSRSWIVHLSDLVAEDVHRLYAELEEQARALLKVTGAMSWETDYSADMSYVGQEFPLTVRFPHLPDSDSEIQLLETWFSDEYQAARGVGLTDYASRITTWRLRLAGPNPPLPTISAPEGNDARPSKRLVYLSDGWLEIPVIQRNALQPDLSHAGPLLIQDVDSTIVLPEQTLMTVSPEMNVVIETSTEDSDG